MSTSEDFQNEAGDYVANMPLGPLDYLIVREPQLDSSLLNLDQEFTEAFEKRMSRAVNAPDLQYVQAGDDMYKTLKIFRRVAQLMGEEWKPVFMRLMNKHNPEMVEQELKQIESHRPLIRGYKALMAWKEMSGSLFHMTKLVDALNANNMADIAQEALLMFKEGEEKAQPVVSLKRSTTRSRRRIDIPAIENDPLNNKVLLVVAKRLAKDWFKFGQTLSIDDSELEDTKDYLGLEHEKLFKILYSWKESNKSSSDCKDRFKKALRQLGRLDVINECFGADN